MLLCLENSCCGGCHLLSAHQQVGCLQVSTLASATCTELLGCSCAIKVAQQNHHNLTELCRASRTYDIPKNLSSDWKGLRVQMLHVAKNCHSLWLPVAVALRGLQGSLIFFYYFEDFFKMSLLIAEGLD